MAMAVFYGKNLITSYLMWGSKFVAGQGRTWPNRTFPVSTSKYSSWEPSHSGEAEKLETFISHFEIRPPLMYVFRDKYIL